MLAILGKVLSWLTGGGLAGLADQFRKTYELKLQADNDEQRLALDMDLARIEAAMHMATVANQDRWSATSIGRYLIVIPFGVWYTLVIADSIFSFDWVILALPQNIMDLSVWLFPAIIIGDLGKTVFRPRRG